MADIEIVKSHSKYDCIMYKASKKSENKWIVIVIDYLNRILVKKKEKNSFLLADNRSENSLKKTPLSRIIFPKSDSITENSYILCFALMTRDERRGIKACRSVTVI